MNESIEELSENMEIVNSLGMHARPAATLVETALKFVSEVHLIVDGARINAKSIMGLLTLAAARGTIVTVVVRGTDAHSAMDAVRSQFEAGFGED